MLTKLIGITLDVALALTITQTEARCHAPTRAASTEASVWGKYKGLYNLRNVTEYCARELCPDGLRPQLSWARDLQLKTNNKPTRTKGF